MRAAFHTFGCKLNQYETESLAAALRSAGLAVVPVTEEAELYLVNTCTVTSKSEQKARRLIRGLARRRPGSLLVVTGCYAQLDPEPLQALGANVLVVPHEHKALLLRLPEHLKAGGTLDRESVLAWLASVRPEASGQVFAFQVERFSFHSRAFLKIQDGCDYRCAYCRVPLARGGSVSLEAEQVLRRAAALEARGYREIVLTGVNICAYRDGPLELGGLVAELLAGTGTARLRLSSLEPERVDEHLAAVLRHPRVCAHFHLPVQSGSDAVLARMGRRYASDVVRRTAEQLRRSQGDPFLAADLIVGFPGESESDFEATRALVAETGFAKLHVFPFSPRPGTRAVGLAGRVPERVRDRRCAQLIADSRRLQALYAARWIGREVEVLLERPVRGSESWRGLSGNYLAVAVGGLPPDAARSGALVRARLRSAADLCAGEFLQRL